MKFFFSVTLTALLISFVAFQSFSQKIKQAVKQNAIHVKLAKTPQQLKGMNFNLSSFDKLNAVAKASSVKRLFPDAGKFEKAHKKYGLDKWYEIEFNNTYGIHLIDSLCRIYQNDENIQIAEPVYIRTHGIEDPTVAGSSEHLFSFPDDPHFSQQWHYYNTGQSGGTANADINLPEAWSVQTGSRDVIVAIIDQGVDYLHPDLAQNMWVNQPEFEGTPGVDDDNNGFVDDIYGYGFGDNTGNIVGQYHGTHVGGTVAAVTNNSVGVSGIAGGSGDGDGVRLMSLAVFGVSWQGGFENSFVYAADNGAVVAQNSWGGGGRSLALEDAIMYFIERAGFDNTDINFDANIQIGPMAGGIVIFAAGNDNSSSETFGYPASFEPVIAVASTDHNDWKSGFSNYGEWVDIAAPGSDILSTFPEENYAYLSGTSMACPHVSGVAALIISEFGGPGFTPAQVEGRLLETTDDIYGVNPDYIGLLGSGRLNAANALLEDDGIPPAAITDLSITDTFHNKVSLTWTATGNSNMEGSASSYDIRYSNLPITESNFSEATSANSTLRPSSAGTMEIFEVNGLEPTTTYYFAVKAADYFGNTSGLSNTVSTITETGPEIAVNPLTITSELFVGRSSLHEMTISNTGGSELEFNLSKRSSASEASVFRAPVRHFEVGDSAHRRELYQKQKQSAGLSKTMLIRYSSSHSSTSVGAKLYAIDNSNNTIAELNPTDGSAVNAFTPPETPSFGSDGLAFDGSYLYYISGWGSNQIYQLDPDNGSVVSQISIPSLPYIDGLGHSGEYLYALSYSSGAIYEIDVTLQEVVRVIDPEISAFGGLTFGGSRNTIFVYAGSLIYELDLISGEVINSFSFFNTVWGLAYSESLGVLLVADVSAEVIQALNPDDGTVEFSYSTSIYSGIAADETAQNWLRFEARNGAIDSGTSHAVEIMINASGLAPGSYTQDVVVASNSVVNNEVIVPVSLNVVGAPKIDTSPAMINFGQQYVETSEFKEFTILNSGTDSLEINGLEIQTSGHFFSVTDTAFVLPPDSSQNILIGFMPVAVGDVVDTLVITSNDPVDSLFRIPLNGTGIEPPVIRLSTDNISEELFTGEESMQNITVFNDGGSDLNFTLRIATDTSDVSDVASVGKDKTPLIVEQGATANTTQPQSEPVKLAASYAGEHLSFGISDYGEVMPFQFPVGNEHLATGSWVSGYSVIYDVGGTDRVKYCTYSDRLGIVPVNFSELINDEFSAKVEVVTRTDDGLLEIIRAFSFDKQSQYLQINTKIRNISGESINDVVFKTFADWDVDNNFSNNWNFDPHRQMIYAYMSNYAAIVSSQVPDYRDIDGWNDFNRRLTDQTIPDGPVSGFDGLQILHFELGNINTEAEIGTLYAAGESLEDLQSIVDNGVTSLSWLRAEPVSGTVPAGNSLSLNTFFNAYKLRAGEYRGNIFFSSNDAVNSEVSVAADLTVTDAPDIDVNSKTFTFDPIFIGQDTVDSLVISNRGFEPLTISNLSLSNNDFSVSYDTLVVEEGSTANIYIHFSPSSTGIISGTLTIESDDPDEGEFIIALSGEGIEPPVFSVDADSLYEALYTGQTSSHFFEISNLEGGSPLEFSISLGNVTVLDESGPLGSGKELKDKSTDVHGAGKQLSDEHLYRFARKSQPTINTISGYNRNLELILDSLNSGYGAINSLIPNRYDFSGGESSYYISDGGGDMYDGGNYLNTNLGGYLYYTGSEIQTNALFGEEGGYFTAKYPGLFVLAADLDEINEFYVDGGLGADGGGSVDGTVLSIDKVDKNYLLFIKRVYDAWEDPSVNHIIIVEDNGSVAHDFSTYTDSDYHRVFNLEGINRLYYLLFASQSGGYITDDEMLSIASAFLDQTGSQFLSLNTFSGSVEAGESLEMEAVFSSSKLPDGIYNTNIRIHTNDPEHPVAGIPATLTVTAAPDISVSDSLIDFGARYLNTNHFDSVFVYNEGIEPLEISSITSSHEDFSVSASNFSIEPGASELILVQFNPTSLGSLNGLLTVNSNDPDEATLTVELRGESVEPPVIALSVESFAEELYIGETKTQNFEITNTGGSPLDFKIITGRVTPLDASGPIYSGEIKSTKSERETYPIQKPSPDQLYSFQRKDRSTRPGLTSVHIELETFRDSLNSGYSAINSLIPNRYDFFEGETAYYINDGGNDMYDGGNFLTTNLSSSYVEYTNGGLFASEAFGGAYFTAKFPGLFVLAADLNGVSDFYIQGDLGADGGGSVDGSVLTINKGTKTYLVLVKRVYDAGDPSVNHVIIVEDDENISHEFPATTESDYHRIYNLNNTTRLYYLLFAGSNGAYISDGEIMAVADAFLNKTNEGFVSFEPATASIESGESLPVEATFSNSSYAEGTYRVEVTFMSNDPLGPMAIPATLTSLGPVAPPHDILLSSDSIDENLPEGSFIGELSAVQSFEGDVSYTYSIVNETNSAFAISGNQLLSNRSFNFENKRSYPVKIRVTDNFKGQFEKDLVIQVRDVNESPYQLTLAGNSIEENQAKGTLVGELHVLDEDFDDTHTFSLKEGAGHNQFFSISGNQLLTSEPLNYEQQSVLDVAVVAQDAAGGIIEDNFTISLLDADDLPEEILLDNNKIEENQPAGTLIGKLEALDEDVNDTSFVYKLVAGDGDADNNKFRISDNELRSTQEFDFEETEALNIRIMAFDPKGNFVESALTVMIVDLDDQITGLDEDDNKAELLLYPNPIMQGKVFLKLENEEIGEVTVSIFALTGQLQSTTRFTKSNFLHIHEITMPTSADGIMILKISLNERVTVRKLNVISH